jgi:hypothetical protein
VTAWTGRVCLGIGGLLYLVSARRSAVGHFTVMVPRIMSIAQP